MKILTNYNDIDRSAWQQLVSNSSTDTWFQTPEAYEFYASLPNEFEPFVVCVPERAVCVGYVTVEKNHVKQFFSRRAIIIGGPSLADDCSDDEVELLLSTLVAKLKSKAIYIETRNFNDYSRWRSVFEKNGFVYEPHNNFHIDTKSFAGNTGDYGTVVAGLMGKGRVRDIKTSFRDGAVVIDTPSLSQIKDFYAILKNLYETKVKTPLFSFDFFKTLYEHKDGRFILVLLNNEIIGGTICVAQEGKCLYEWFVAGRDGEWKSIFPSSVATYAGVRYAAEHNMPRFDMMGAGTPDQAYGVRDFKARFGGELVEHGRFKKLCSPLLYKVGCLAVKLLKH